MDPYIVSARKYRPTTFDSVVGQEALTTTLKSAIAAGKLAHAYLFCGPRGVGKTTCARIFARTINCLNPTPTGDPCGSCESCMAFQEQRSFNIQELDAASNNSVDDMRELIDKVQIPPQVGRYKVFIIDEVHMLSTAAFNAFLKTLEEPPAHAIFILATTEKHKILPTILSRCQIFDFQRMTVADIVKHLLYVAQSEGITCDTEALHVIAEKADGGMRDALSIFDQVASFCGGNITYAKVIEDLNVLDYDEYFSMTNHLLKVEVPQAMLQLNGILAKGFDARIFINGLAGHLRNVLMCRDAQTLPLLDVSDQVRQRYQEQATRCKPTWLYSAIRLCTQCDQNYRTAGNKRLLVELTLIEAAQAAADDEGAGCGRGPIRKLKPLFQAPAAQQAAAGAPATKVPAQTPQHPTATAQPAPAPQPAAASTPPRPATSRPRRVVASLSINALGRDYDLKRQQATQATQQEAATTGRGTTAAQTTGRGVRLQPFDDDRLTYYWFSFAQKLPQEQNAMAGRLKNMQPHVTQDWQVEVTLDNEFVLEHMTRLRPSLTAYLREQLANDAIQLVYHVAAKDAQHRPYSQKEKLQDMLSRSPELAELCRNLQLELA